MKTIYSIIFGVAVFAISYQYNLKLVDWLRFHSIGARDEIVEKLGLMFIDIPPNRVLLYMVLAAVIPFLICFLLFLPKISVGVVTGLALASLGWFLPRPIVNYMMAKRMELFSVQMVDGLNLMANAMKSGLSVAQAMGIVVEQAPNPLAQEFSLVLSQTKLGISLEEALEGLAKRLPSEDVEMFVTSVVILKETGGNLAETFDTIVHVIRERIKVQAKITAMTTMGKTQGLTLLCIPPVMFLLVSSSDPEMMDGFLASPIGWIAIGVVVLLEVTAYWAINKVVQIDV